MFIIFLDGSYVAIARIHSNTYLVNDIKNYMYVCLNRDQYEGDVNVTVYRDSFIEVMNDIKD